MKQKTLIIAFAVILALIISVLFILLINSEHWNLKTCNDECIHRGYDFGNCYWPNEVNDDYINIGSCLIPQSKHCGNKGQCNCYCEYEK